MQQIDSFLNDPTENYHEIKAQLPQSQDADLVVLFSRALKVYNPEQVFIEAFAITNDAKSLYKRLVKVAHPDTGGSADLFQLVNAAYSKYRDNSAGYQEVYTVNEQLHEQCAGSTLSPEELSEWLSYKVPTCEATLSSEELDEWFQ
jgi:hypothetical protein